MGYNWKKRLGEELKTEKNVRDCGGIGKNPGSRTAGRWEKKHTGKNRFWGIPFAAA